MIRSANQNWIRGANPDYQTVSLVLLTLIRSSRDIPSRLSEQHAGTMGDTELEIRKLELLEKLQQSKPPAVDVFQMRDFIGLEFEEIAKLLEISLDEVEGLYRFARAWVLRELTSSH